jgi:alpha-1,6-mannosyltransferase
VTSLHITNAYHAASGGVRTFYHALLEAGNREGRRVVLVVPGEHTDVAEVGRFGRIYFIKAPHALAFDRRYRLILPHRYAPLVQTTLVRILADERPDVVEICDKYALPYLASMLRKGWHRDVRRPTLIGLTCERFDDGMAAYVTRSAAARAFTRWYLRNIYGPAFDVHIAISDYTAEELRGALHDRPPGFVRVCPPGVDISAFRPERASAAIRARLLRESGGDAGSVLLFYAGRLSPEKNLGLLIEMLRELQAVGDADYRLVIAGDGPSAGSIRRQSTGGVAGRIHLCGALDRDTLADYYASCDVFVHPNAREPFGIGPLEAMASGVPVVLPNRGGVLEYASSQNTWLASPDARAFAAAVTAARRGDPRRIGMAIETARQFNWTRVTSRYFALYDEVQGRFWGSRRPEAQPVPIR